MSTRLRLRYLPAPILIFTMVVMLLGLALTTSSPAAAATGGNILLTGHDAELHCAGGGPQCHYFKVALDFVRGGSSLPVLSLDHRTMVPDAITSAYTGGSAPTVVNVDPRTQFAGTPLLDPAGRPLYSAIVVASDTTCGGCDNNESNSTPDSDAINARSADIAAFFNAGGGIMALAGAAHRDVYYKFLPIPATGVAVSPPFKFTSVGLSLGFVEGTDDNCCPTHNSFQLPPSGSALQVAETDSKGLAETLVAQNATICPGGFCGGGDTTLTVSASSGGTVSVSPPNPPGGPGSYTYPAGTTVTLTATPDSGYIFTGWLIGGVFAGAGNPLTITMNANYNVSASFGPPLPGWSDWKKLGGILTDSPTATNFNGRVYVFAKGSDNALYAMSSADGATWTDWQNLGGVLTGAPAATSFQGQLYVFARGTGDRLYMTRSADGVSFSGWQDLGGILRDAPGAASANGVLYVFARGTGDRLYATSSTDGVNFGGWQELGGILTSAPAATGFLGQVYIFAKGSDNSLYEIHSTDGINFSPWRNLGGRLFAAPAAATVTPSDGPETLYVLATGTGDRLYERHTTSGGPYTEWRGLDGQVVGVPAAAGVAGRFFAFVRSRDNALWERHTP